MFDDCASSLDGTWVPSELSPLADLEDAGFKGDDTVGAKGEDCVGGEIPKMNGSEAELRLPLERLFGNGSAALASVARKDALSFSAPKLDDDRPDCWASSSARGCEYLDDEEDAALNNGADIMFVPLAISDSTAPRYHAGVPRVDLPSCSRRQLRC
jgi:hypothetical protein